MSKARCPFTSEGQLTKWMLLQLTNPMLCVLCKHCKIRISYDWKLDSPIACATRARLGVQVTICMLHLHVKRYATNQLMRVSSKNVRHHETKKYKNQKNKIQACTICVVCSSQTPNVSGACILMASMTKPRI